MRGFRRPFVRGRVRLHGDERGFTMVEVLAAILIFGILIGGIASMQSTTLNLIRNNRHRAVAANLASEEMDTVRSTAFENLAIGQAVTTRTIDSVDYTVTRESEWIPRNASAGACDAPSGSDPAYLRVNVFVTWPVMTGTAPVDSHTIITPPVGTYDEDTGHVAVRVLDRDAQPVGGVQIALSGTESASQFTNSDGCVFFAFLTPGGYTATASAAGFVSDQGVASPVQPVSVVQGAISSLLFAYDRAATLSLTLTGKDSGAPAPADVPLVFFNTSILPTGLLSKPGTGIPRVVDGLFPYASGYSVWAGSCGGRGSGRLISTARDPTRSPSSRDRPPPARCCDAGDPRRGDHGRAALAEPVGHRLARGRRRLSIGRELRGGAHRRRRAPHVRASLRHLDGPGRLDGRLEREAARRPIHPGRPTCRWWSRERPMDPSPPAGPGAVPA